MQCNCSDDLRATESAVITTSQTQAASDSMETTTDNEDATTSTAQPESTTDSTYSTTDADVSVGFMNVRDCPGDVVSRSAFIGAVVVMAVVIGALLLAFALIFAVQCYRIRSKTTSAIKSERQHLELSMKEDSCKL